MTPLYNQADFASTQHTGKNQGEAQSTQNNGANLYVDNLPVPMSEAALKSLFSEFGQILSTRLACDPVSGAQIGYAFVLFSRAEEAQSAIQRLHGRSTGLPGKSLHVSVAKTRTPISFAANSNAHMPMQMHNHTQYAMPQHYTPLSDQIQLNQQQANYALPPMSSQAALLYSASSSLLQPPGMQHQASMMNLNCTSTTQSNLTSPLTYSASNSGSGPSTCSSLEGAQQQHQGPPGINYASAIPASQPQSHLLSASHLQSQLQFNSLPNQAQPPHPSICQSPLSAFSPMSLSAYSPQMALINQATAAMQFNPGNQLLSPSISVPACVPLHSPPPPDSTVLYVANLPRQWSLEQVNALMSQFGEIQESKLLLDTMTQQSRGVAFVRFTTEQQAASAIQALAGQVLPIAPHATEYSINSPLHTVPNSNRPLIVKIAHDKTHTRPEHRKSNQAYMQQQQQQQNHLLRAISAPSTSISPLGASSLLQSQPNSSHLTSRPPKILHPVIQMTRVTEEQLLAIQAQNAQSSQLASQKAQALNQFRTSANAESGSIRGPSPVAKPVDNPAHQSDFTLPKSQSQSSMPHSSPELTSASMPPLHPHAHPLKQQSNQQQQSRDAAASGAGTGAAPVGAHKFNASIVASPLSAGSVALHNQHSQHSTANATATHPPTLKQFPPHSHAGSGSIGRSSFSSSTASPLNLPLQEAAANANSNSNSTSAQVAQGQNGEQSLDQDQMPVGFAAAQDHVAQFGSQSMPNFATSNTNLAQATPSQVQAHANHQANHRQFGSMNSNSDSCLPSRDLFVFHLPSLLSDAEMHSLFSLFGGVCVSACVIRDSHSGASKGFGFVSMNSIQEAAQCIQELNGARLGNKYLSVSFKKSRLQD